MSKRKREILEHLVEYLQQKIDSGEHKIFFNDLMWDEKTIDCINAINNTLEEIERLNKALLDIKELVVNNACLDDSINKCVDDLIYYKCDELLDIVNKALGSERVSEEDKLKTNNEKVTINDYYYYYLLKCEDALNELEKYIDEDDWTSVNGEIAVRLIKLKLQELKGNNLAIPPEVIGTNGVDGGLFDYGDR